SNRVAPGEQDLNPLRRFISDVKPPMTHEVDINFDNKIQLIGWDAPAIIAPRQDFKLRLFFKVNAALPASYKIFVHIDAPGTRINGDHIPPDGKFPTNYWVPGTFIIDEHQVRPGDNNTGGAPPAGGYTILVGLFQGNERLKVVSGTSDGENRARIGALQIR